MNSFHTITELPGTRISKLQLRRSYQRYKFASDLNSGGNVLEIGCGGGQGLALLAENSEKVFGCDINEINLKIARSTYEKNELVEIFKMDAEELHFEENYFSSIILFETIYYLKDVKIFLSKCSKLLKKNGKLIICTANKDWPDFNPSPFSTKYFSVPELNNILIESGFDVTMYGGFPDFKNGLIPQILSVVKKYAIKLHLIPKTMKGKLLLKKIFYGKTVLLPKSYYNNLIPYEKPTLISNNQIDNIHTAIFAIAKKPNQ